MCRHNERGAHKRLCFVNTASKKSESKKEKIEFLIFNLLFKVSMYVGARMAALEEKRLMTERGGECSRISEVLFSFSPKFMNLARGA